MTDEMLKAIALLESAGFTVMRCKPGELYPLSEEEAACGVALFRNLKERGGLYVAVRASGPLNWDITEPRTQEALLAALETKAAASVTAKPNELLPARTFFGTPQERYALIVQLAGMRWAENPWTNDRKRP